MKEIKLSRALIAIVDDEDFSFLSQFTWSARNCMGRDFAVTAKRVDGKNHTTYLHRLILLAPKNLVVDHINGNGLDNRKSNLRICTKAENSRNRKPNKNRIYKGVRAVNNVKAKKFAAIVWHNGTTHYLGRFDSEVEAATAYDQKAKEFFGEFANLNFPEIVI